MPVTRLGRQAFCELCNVPYVALVFPLALSEMGYILLGEEWGLSSTLKNILFQFLEVKIILNHVTHKFASFRISQILIFEPVRNRIPVPCTHERLVASFRVVMRRGAPFPRILDQNHRALIMNEASCSLVEPVLLFLLSVCGPCSSKFALELMQLAQVFLKRPSV